MTARDLVPIRRALLSVSDKRGLVELARALTAHSVELVSTGGTARALRDAGFLVTEVAAVTGFPEIMDGRVKTLHPLVHGALLARDGLDDDALAAHAITPIDLLVVNLYPFEQVTADPACDMEQGIENIDIGGPAMLRAAAKNHARVAVLVDPADYAHIAAALPDGTGLAQRRLLAAKAYAHTARYDGRIADWLGGRAAGAVTAFGPTLHLAFERGVALRYGENPHQAGALYLEPGAVAGTAATARVLQGKEVSYNNIADGDAAVQCVKQFEAPACVIVKHANPCGVATGEDPGAAYERAYATDPQSAFGGVIAFNRPLDAGTARRVLERQFVEMVLAPEVLPAALAAFGAKPNVRVLATGAWSSAVTLPARDYRRVAGGLLVQDADADRLRPEDFEVVSRRAPDAAELADLHFAWKVAMYVKSNAIVYARDGRTVGIGAGQMSRVTSARIAALKAAEAGLEVRGSVMASDAFFPFRDGIDAAAQAGIRAVIQPGGSMRDREVIAAVDEHGMAMVFTKTRHFRH